MPKPSLAADGGWAYLLATVLANAASFGFHLTTSRLLGPAGYGALMSLLGIVTAAALPVSALQAAVAQALASRRPPSAGALRQTLLRSWALALLCVLVLAAASPLIDRFLDLTTPLPALLLAATVGLTIASVVPGGALLGTLRFKPLAVALALGGAVRLASGTGLVAAGLGVSGAAGASVLAAGTTLAVLCWPLRRTLRRPVHGVDARLAGDPQPGEALTVGLRAALLAVVALAGVSTFLGVDAALARHFLAPRLAGAYAAAATVARIGLFLPGSIALAAFPRLAATADPAEARQLLGEALGLTALVGGVAAAVIAAVPHLLVGALFGRAYRAAAGPLVVLAAAGAVVGLATVLVYFFLSRRSVVSATWWFAVAGLTGAVLVSHRSPLAVAWATLGVTCAMALALLLAAVGALGRALPDRSLPDGSGAEGPGREPSTLGEPGMAPSQAGP
ncbi:oligosaccharide flippase family protein [Aciditerrimonas ferrireducens]|uniref:Oligosaccharide flippase family protein n=1 Tax=Aciditerrimonas ferrireducens TaxID=667306 RepID=A0ABV6C145_9ACTN